jgi:hypothetical protein
MAHLISTTNLKALSYITSNVDDLLLATLITRVQDTVLESILGSQLFNRLLTGVNDNDLNANETNLLDNYIAPCLVAAVERRSIDMTTLELRQIGLSKVSSEGVSNANENEMNRVDNSLNKDYNFYRERLITFLKLNYTLFPEYTSYYEYLYPCDDLSQINPDRGSSDVNITFA